jgi:hypothetical protein
VILSDNKVRRVNHADEGDRELLRQVYEWAKARPDLYIDGKGYRNADHFIEKPGDAIEYFVIAGGKLVALLTLTRHEPYRDIFDVGLITDPGANLFTILKLLKEFMAFVFETMAEALYVQLPPRAEFQATRRLAQLFGFQPVSENSFLIFKSDYVAQNHD